MSNNILTELIAHNVIGGIRLSGILLKSSPHLSGNVAQCYPQTIKKSQINLTIELTLNFQIDIS